MMEKATMQPEETSNMHKIALLVSLSCILQIAESLIPHPIPGLRLGLANVITLIALATLGFGCALEITILRTILSSFIMGTFMSPGFILSFSAGLISTLIMGFLFWLLRFGNPLKLSIVGISIIGAFFHNLAQLYLAYLILIRHMGIFVFLPWLTIGAVVMGWITGIAAGRVCMRIKETVVQDLAFENHLEEYSGIVLSHYSPGKSFLHRLPAEIKIAGIFTISLAVLILNNFWFYVALFFFLLSAVVISQTSFAFLFSRAKRYSSLIFASLLFPVFFNSGKHALFQIASFKITSEGLSMGILFTSRVFFLMAASLLLARTTSPKDLTNGLTRLLSPLRPLGISEKRISGILSLSWITIPIFWEMARKRIRAANFKNVKSLRNLIPLVSDFIAELYLESERLTTFWTNICFSQDKDLVCENELERNADSAFLREEVRSSV